LSFIIFKTVLPRLLEQYFPKYLTYIIEQSFANNGGNLMKFFYLAILFYCVTIALLYKNFIINRGLFSILTIGVCCPFIFGSMTGNRISQYFLIYLLLLIPNVNSRISINKRALFLMIFYIYFFIFLFITMYKNNTSDYIPYQFYFFADKNKIK
jgi:hypothetical protein